MRKRRELSSSAIYHIAARVNRQELIFDSIPTLEFKKLFIAVLSAAQKKYDFKLYNFVIMGNHVHLQLEPQNGFELSKIMQWLLSGFARAYNKHFGYKGHVWYDRYKSKIIRTTRHFVNTFLYIAANPTRARLCDNPLSWKFNGIRYLCSKKHEDEIKPLMLETPHPLVLVFLDKMLGGLYTTFNHYRKSCSV